MKVLKELVALTMLSLLVACSGPNETATVPQAEPAGVSFVDIGTHVVHFSAQSTAQLPIEVARAYNILRSKNRAMLNVSVLEDATDKTVSATVVVKTVNLTGQLKNITIRQIEEGDAIYYIAETPVANQETLIFDITVQPEGVAQASNVRFKQQFYTD